MKRLFVLVLAALLLMSGIAYSADSTVTQQSTGSGNDGFFAAIGYDGSQADIDFFRRGGSPAGSSNRWTNGVDVEARYETSKLWSRGRFEYENGSGRNLYRYELTLGYKILNAGPSTLTPYIGIGYVEHDGRSNFPLNNSDYTWGYVPIGLNYVYSFKNWSIGADAALQVPFDMKVKGTFTDGQEGTADIHSGIGARVEVPVTADIYKPKLSDRFKVLGFLTPYYQYWRQEASDTIVTQNHRLYFVKTKSDDFGFKIGVGINF